MGSDVNYFAIVAAALSTFLIGGLWYSPAIFGKAWMAENGFTEEGLKNSKMVRIFGLSFILALVAAFNLAIFLGEESRIPYGALYGFLAGFGWVAMFIGTHYLFERKTFRLFAINAGYAVVALTIMGAILAAWK